MTESHPTTDQAPQRSKRRGLFVAVCLVGIPLALSGLDHLAGEILSPPPRDLLFPSGSRVQHESCEFDVPVEISSQGLRDREFSRHASEGTTRVVAIGDSFTFGWGVQAEESWPKVLERSGKGPLEVVNFGFPGASPNDYSRIISGALEHFQPDMVLVGTLQGDDLIQLVEQAPEEVPWTTRASRATFPTLSGWVKSAPPSMESYRSVFRKSQAYLRSTLTPDQQHRYGDLSPRVHSAFESGLLNPSLVHTAMTTPRRFLEPIEGGPAWQANAETRLRRCVRQWATDCRRAGAVLKVVIVPDGPYVSEAAAAGMRAVGYEVPGSLTTSTVCQDVVIEICKEAGVTVVNPVAEFRQAANSDRPSDYFELDGHFNSNGQRRLGESVARSLWPTTE
ncbi:MAG: hypothetical protein VX304_04300 [Planctomycetota bacterium]|nr:hypothetical protein [Planctomycetota bacterium]